MRKLRTREGRLFAGGGGPLYSYGPAAPPTPPLRDSLAVFRRGRERPDQLPRALRRQLEQSDQMEERLAASRGSADSTLPGSDESLLTVQAAQGGGGKASSRMLAVRRLRPHGDSLPDESRLLVGPVESQGMRLFAIPTTTGHVRFSAFRKHDGGGMGSVAWLLDRGMTWFSSWTSRGDLIDLGVFGLLADDVTSVVVELEDGSTHSAQLGENGFVLEARTATHDIKRFRLGHRDGTGISVEP